MRLETKSKIAKKTSRVTSEEVSLSKHEEVFSLSDTINRYPKHILSPILIQVELNHLLKDLSLKI